MRRFVISLTLFAVVLSAAPAAARQRSGTVFIGAGGFAAIEKAPTTRGLGSDDDGSGTVPGGALVVGIHLTRRVSARFEWGLTDTLTQEQRIGINPLALTGDFWLRVGATGPSSSITQLSIVDQRTRIERKSMTGLALLGYHVDAGRASIELLGGLAIVNQDVKTSYDVRILSGLILPYPQPEYTASNYQAAAVVGSDVAVSLTDHLAVVPSVRAYVLNGGLSVRPGVGLRWTF
jgi:hypothetical protein